MSKTAWFLCALAMMAAAPYAESATVLIAPVICYDGANKRLELEENPNRTLVRMLKEYWFAGVVRFRAAGAHEYGNVASAYEAQKAAAASGAEYVLYGFARRTEASWHCELKLYSGAEKRSVKSFFASDDAARYVRLVETVASRVREHLNEALGLAADDVTLKGRRAHELRVPFALCVWAPVGRGWSDALAGVVGTHAALEFFPEQPEVVRRGLRFEFSCCFELGWMLGIGSRSRYEAVLNGIRVAAPAACYMHVNGQHALYAALGPIYELDVLAMKGKYERSSVHVANRLGLAARVGWQCALGGRWAVFMSLEGDFYFSRGTFHALKPNFGAAYRVWRKGGGA